MDSIRQLCKNCVVLKNGSIDFYGYTPDSINYYLSSNGNNNNVYRPSNNVVKLVEVDYNQDFITITLDYESKKAINYPSLGFVLFDSLGNKLLGSNPIIEWVEDFGNPQKKGTVIAKIKNPGLADGKYSISIWFNDGKAYDNHIFEKEKCISFNVLNLLIGKQRNMTEYLGPIRPDVTYSFLPNV